MMNKGAVCLCCALLLSGGVVRAMTSDIATTIAGKVSHAEGVYEWLAGQSTYNIPNCLASADEGCISLFCRAPLDPATCSAAVTAIGGSPSSAQVLAQLTGRLSTCQPAYDSCAKACNDAYAACTQNVETSCKNVADSSAASCLNYLVTNRAKAGCTWDIKRRGHVYILVDGKYKKFSTVNDCVLPMTTRLQSDSDFIANLKGSDKYQTCTHDPNFLRNACKQDAQQLCGDTKTTCIASANCASSRNSCYAGGCGKDLICIMCQLTKDPATCISELSVCKNYTGNNLYACALTHVLMTNKGVKDVTKAATCADYVIQFKNKDKMRDCLLGIVPSAAPTAK